ncbi:unnamed protein product [Closterium sp. Naga37s-1]|nr:unnamed protein product [Closterium sp. Naga37s-1]
MNTTIAPIGPSFVDMRGVVVNPGKRQMWVSFMSAFGKDMSASAVVARLRLSLRLKRKWRPFQVFLERFKVVGVGGGNSLIQPTIALNRWERGGTEGADGKEGREGSDKAGKEERRGECYPYRALTGIIAASLAGRSFYPSAAYATLNANVDVGRVVVTGPGKAPLDDFTGYRGATEMRYGDYMTATMDEEGNAWAAVHGGNGDNGGSGDSGGNGDNGGNGDHEGK